MAFQTESAQIGQIAFPAPFRYRHNMIGIPERLTVLQLPFFQGSQFRNPTQALYMRPFRDAVQTAKSADAAIPFPYSLSQVAGIGAEFPFFDTPVRTE
jgi:hypothetical protein